MWNNFIIFELKNLFYSSAAFSANVLGGKTLISSESKWNTIDASEFYTQRNSLKCLIYDFEKTRERRLFPFFFFFVIFQYM